MSADDLRSRLSEFARVREERFDRIVRLAARLLDVPVAMINLVTDQQWTKASHGIDVSVTPLDESVCRYATASGERFEVDDLSADARFADYSHVRAGQQLRFYAGEPLKVDGERLGVLCVLDDRPRTLTADQSAVLAELAAWAEAELNHEALAELAQRMAERELRLHAVLDAAPEAVLLVEDDGLAVVANSEAEAVLGIAVDERVPLQQVLPAYAFGREPFVQSGAAGTSGSSSGIWRAEVLVRAVDGARVPVEATVTQFVQDGRRVWAVFARDLRAQLAADAALREQEVLTRQILESAADGIVGADGEGVVVFANPAAAAMLGYREAELVGRPLREMLQCCEPATAPEDCRTCRAVLQGVVQPAHEEVFVRADGSRLEAESNVAPIAAGLHGRGSVVVFRDISTRKEVERVKGEFLGVVSHELRTPLTSIKGSLRLLDAGAAGSVEPRQQPLLRMALDNADRLGRLVDDILDMERLDAGRLPLRPERTDARDLARQVVDSLQPAAEVSGLRLELAPAASGAATTVVADPSRLVQAITNLVGNAVKFTPSGGRVDVAVEGGGGTVRVDVTDTGPGIAPSELQAVFDRFHQASLSDPAAAKGTGLGLAITKGLVERSGGHVGVRSEVGVGSTFTIELPEADDATKDTA